MLKLSRNCAAGFWRLLDGFSSCPCRTKQSSSVGAPGAPRRSPKYERPAPAPPMQALERTKPLANPRVPTQAEQTQAGSQDARRPPFRGPLRPRLPPKPVENVPSFPPQRGPIDEHSQLDRGRIPRRRTPPREALVDGPPRCRHGKTSFCLNLAVSLAARRLVPGLPDAADLARNHRPGMRPRPARSARACEFLSRSNLPEPPSGVRSHNVQQIVSSELRSGSSFHKWFTECQRLSVIVPAAKALRNTR